MGLLHEQWGVSRPLAYATNVRATSQAHLMQRLSVHDHRWLEECGMDKARAERQTAC
jgi:hypothetical protein